ncbi:unnamed protein product [Agarophyton chilense]|eukprot:gb/GEZJ01003732.1/.p3 GENE.gb/GEZJ01003732.1/~~gb/GEZJ01003732.1/.p3  ORF type:complete len:210 (-),score=45.30 gb/GEZJ01003732.1/:4228-4857(-)
MKILSSPEGDGLLTNAEVHEWLKQKQFQTERRDVPEHEIKPPHATASISKQVQKYIETSPAGNITVASLGALFAKLEKFSLSAVEKLMIANIRPEAYAHLTPIIVDAFSRYDEDQLYEMLGIIDETLEKRTKPSEWNADDAGEQTHAMATEAPEQMNVNPQAILQQAANGANLGEQHAHEMHTTVKQEITENTQHTIDSAVNAVNGVRL